MKPKVYMETTIPSYLTSRPSRDLVIAAHQQITREWWKKRRNGFDIYISQFVVDEAGADALAARDRLQAIQGLPILDIIPAVGILAAGFLESKRTLPLRPCTAWISW